MNARTLVLLSASFGIAGIGLGYLIAPGFMYGLYGIGIESVNEANMVRSAYGGLFLGFGILFLLGSFKEALAKSALMSLLIFMGSFAVGRLLSIALDGLPSMLILGLVLLEIVYAVLAAWLLSKESLQ